MTKYNYGDRIDAAVGLCKVAGLDPNEVTDLTLRFEQHGETYITARIIPRFDRLASYIKTIPIFVEPAPEPIEQTIARLDRVIANVRHYQ